MSYDKDNNSANLYLVVQIATSPLGIVQISSGNKQISSAQGMTSMEFQTLI